MSVSYEFEIIVHVNFKVIPIGGDTYIDMYRNSVKLSSKTRRYFKLGEKNILINLQKEESDPHIFVLLT